jgi:hypothetical protein
MGEPYRLDALTCHQSPEPLGALTLFSLSCASGLRRLWRCFVNGHAHWLCRGGIPPVFTRR